MSVPPPSPPKKLQQDYSTMGTPRLPTCNFCEQLYDPYDRHTCVGNDIPAKFKRSIPKPLPLAVSADGFILAEESKPGLTRQQIGEALDADRAASSAGESALDEMLDLHALELRQKTVRTRIETLKGVASALNTQAGGDHYRKMKIQPVEYIIANGIGFLPGNIIKYASRYPEKGGAEDIRKIIHYCKLILEFEYGERNGG